MRQALIITHPTERFGVKEDEILDYLEDNSQEYDEIFYISSEYDPAPAESLSSFFPNKDNRSDLPPGFEEGFYDRGLREAEERTGRLHEGEIDELKRYDRIDVAGGWKHVCVSNTLQSLPKDPEKGILDSITYESQ